MINDGGLGTGPSFPGDIYGKFMSNHFKDNQIVDIDCTVIFKLISRTGAVSFKTVSVPLGYRAYNRVVVARIQEWKQNYPSYTDLSSVISAHESAKYVDTDVEVGDGSNPSVNALDGDYGNPPLTQENLGKGIRDATSVYFDGHGAKGYISTIAGGTPVGNPDNFFSFRHNDILGWRSGSSTPPINLAMIHACRTGTQVPPEDPNDLNDAFLYPSYEPSDVVDRAYVSWSIGSYVNWTQAFNGKFYGELVAGASVKDARNEALDYMLQTAVYPNQWTELDTHDNNGSYVTACPIWGDQSMKFNSLYNGGDEIESTWYKID